MKQNANHLSISTYQTGLLQSKAHRALATFMTESLNQSDISLPQWAVLGLLFDNDDSRPYKIAAMLGVRPPVATAVINELEYKKMVVRKPHATDNRATVISLTRKGKTLVGKVETRLYKKLREFLDDVTTPELVVYIRVMAKLAAKS
jgi:MarR family 2-MHQ and catechol resistance regulon transcriptional repressor